MSEEDIIYVESETNPFKKYAVNIRSKTCTCPHFKFRLRGKGICKHLNRILNYKVEKYSKDVKKLVDFVRENEKVEFLELNKKFDENIIQVAIMNASIIEITPGKFIVLE